MTTMETKRLEYMHALKEANEVRLRQLGENALYHPLFSIILKRRVRFKEAVGEFIFCTENDGVTPLEYPLHISQVTIY